MSNPVGLRQLHKTNEKCFSRRTSTVLESPRGYERCILPPAKHAAQSRQKGQRLRSQLTSLPAKPKPADVYSPRSFTQIFCRGLAVNHLAHQRRFRRELSVDRCLAFDLAKITAPR